MRGGERTRGVRALAAVAGLLALAAVARPAQAGGIRTVKNGKIGITVYFTYDPQHPEASLTASGVSQSEMKRLLENFGPARSFEEESKLWEPVFQEFSRQLYDATEGQLSLGTVTFTRDLSLKNDADVWIHHGTEVERAHLGGVNNRAQHIDLYQQHKCMGMQRMVPGTVDQQPPPMRVCFDAQNLDVRGQFALLHEAGHYFFGLMDEYAGQCSQYVAGARVASCGDTLADPAYFWCSRGNSDACCIMDGSSRDPRRNRRTEFCVGSAGVSARFRHLGTYLDLSGRCVTNAQQAQRGGACWDTMAAPTAEIPLQAPLGGEPAPQVLPAVVGTAPRALAAGEEFVLVEGLPAFAFVLDTSASMSVTDPGQDLSRLVLAQLGTINALDTLRDEERIAIVTFSDDVSVPLPASQGRVADVRGTARTLVQTIQTASGWTNLGGALQAGFDELDPLPDATVATKAIILLSDGRHTLGTPVADVLPAIRDVNRVVVHTIAFGPDADVEALQAIARETGGTFYLAQNAADSLDRGSLSTIFPKVLAAARGETVLFEAGGSVPRGKDASGLPRRTVVSVDLDPYTSSATFVLTYLPERLRSRPPHLELVSPRGDRIYVPDPVNAAEGEDACFLPAAGGGMECGQGLRFVRNEGQRLYRVPARYLMPGTWQVEVVTTRDASDPVAEDAFQVLVLGEQETVAVVADVVSAQPSQFPEALRIEAVVLAGTAVAGAEVSARVAYPGGAEETILLHDDGRPDHGDAVANDGVYSALFLDYRSASDGGGDGVHLFDVRVENVDGYEAVGIDDDPSSVGTRRSVPPFTAHGEACGVVRGIPDPIPVGGLTLGVASSGATPAPVANPIAIEAPADELDNQVVLQFALTVDQGAEQVKVKSLAVRSTGTGDETTLGPVRLYLDADKDGRPDNESSPLATGYFQTDDDATGAVLTAPGMLALLSPGTTNFLVTIGPIRAEWIPQPPQPGGTAARLPPLPVVPLWIVLAGAFAVLAWIVVRRVPVPRALWPVLQGACLVLAIVLAGTIGCGGGGTVITDDFPPPPQPPDLPAPDPGTYDFVLDGASIVANGATTRLGSSVSGGDVAANVNLTPPLFE